MKLTRHVLKRGNERSIHPEMLVKILSGKFISIPSDKDPTAELVIGMYDGKIWTVIMNIETGVVITARRAHGKEIAKYEETFKR